MNKIITLLLLTSTLFFTSCKKKLTQFYLDYNSELVIPSTFGNFVPFSLNTPENTTNSSFEFENNDTDAGRVKSIYLEDLDMSIISPSGETFSFLNSIEMFLSSPSQAERRVAFKTDIPSTAGTTLTLDLEGIDLKEYIKESTFTLRLKVVTDETMPQDVEVNIYSNFLVDAKIKGLFK